MLGVAPVGRPAALGKGPVPSALAPSALRRVGTRAQLPPERLAGARGNRSPSEGMAFPFCLQNASSVCLFDFFAPISAPSCPGGRTRCRREGSGFAPSPLFAKADLSDCWVDLREVRAPRELGTYRGLPP